MPGHRRRQPTLDRSPEGSSPGWPRSRGAWALPRRSGPSPEHLRHVRTSRQTERLSLDPPAPPPSGGRKRLLVLRGRVVRIAHRFHAVRSFSASAVVPFWTRQKQASRGAFRIRRRDKLPRRKICGARSRVSHGFALTSVMNRSRPAASRPERLLRDLLNARSDRCCAVRFASRSLTARCGRRPATRCSECHSAAELHGLRVLYRLGAGADGANAPSDADQQQQDRGSSTKGHPAQAIMLGPELEDVLLEG